MSKVTSQMSIVSFAFWGTDEFAVNVLEILKKSNTLPSLIVTAPDRPVGRKLVLTSPPIKLWAEKNNIKFVQPEKIDSEFCSKLSGFGCELFLVASYGKILPKKIIELPKYKTLNIHPSLLPKLRGPSPIQNAILKEEKTGVTIMRMDDKMDHGPIIVQKELKTKNWPIDYENLSKSLSVLGANLFLEILPKWLNNEAKEIPQNESYSTYTEKIKKGDGEINLKDNPEKNYRKFLAFKLWPGVYFFTERNGKNIRVIVKKASIQNGRFVIETVLPEGKKEMKYDDFLKGRVTSS